MKYKGIIFDLDGVLCSTDEYHYLAWKALTDELGIPFDRQINNRLRGVSRAASLDIILEQSAIEYTLEEKKALADQKNEVYRQLLQQMSPADLSEEVMETLAFLRAGGFKLAVGSSSRNAPYILQRLGLDHFFDAVADGSIITNSKPHPEVFLKAADMLGLAPQACLVVEDAHAGVAAACAGGFDCAAMGDAYSDEHALYHLATFSDLRKIVTDANIDVDEYA